MGIGLGLLVFSNLSRKWMLRVCDFVSAVMYRFDKKGRCRSLANLRVILGKIKSDGIVRPEKVYNPSSTEEKIIRRSYRNMARTVGHAFWTSRNAIERVKSAGEMSEVGKRFLAENNPAVTVSGHIGCWEILSQLALLEGHKMMSVAKDIGTGGMTKLLMKARTSIGQEIVHADGAFRPLMQGLKEGKSLGLLVDQVVKPKDGGVWVKFFGVPIPVSAAPAFFSAKGKAPIVVAWSRPLKDGRYRCEIVATYKPEEARDIRGMTQRCISDLERVIRRHPSAWVLNYNYFKNIASDEIFIKD
ncbi:MAG: lysophospholipid acyltransferase family protein [Kiritimatiellae bacterium]|nr:lysophospholipid acyltransferase family protein [Kiritimatiellia bacterium]